jgi:hypothetical protein
MASLLEDFNLWLAQTSAEVGIPLEVFIFLLSANIVLLIVLLIFALKKIWMKGGEHFKKGEQKPGSGERKSEVTSGTLSELIEEQRK